MPNLDLFLDDDLAMAERLRVLSAGPLRFCFDLSNGIVRHVFLGEHEVLRGIYVAVRDRNWDTIAPEISNLRIDPYESGRASQSADACCNIAFTAECRRGAIHFQWQGHLQAWLNGTLHYDMRGQAVTTFERNRIGFCVLHPIRECAGHSCRVTHTDHRIEVAKFPEYIAPHQPFKQIKAIRHEITRGVEAEVRFAGEIFEMEDQRNWTDASYKTYGTPLELPFPVTVTAGSELAQSITLTIDRTVAARTTTSSYETSIHAEDRTALDSAGHLSHQLPAIQFGDSHLPPIGLSTADVACDLNERQCDRLAHLHLGHLRVALPLDRVDGTERLQSACMQATNLNVPLNLAITLDADGQESLIRLVDALARIKPNIANWYVFHRREKSTSREWIEIARQHLRCFSPNAKFFGGTDAYFAELNRQRPDVTAMDGVCYSISPQVHAFDNLSLVESLQAQPETVRSARQFCGHLPLHVGPITLKPRFNPNATGPEPRPELGKLPTHVDPRQCGLLAAGWTLVSVAQLSTAGADQLTYYETVGWAGVMELPGGSALPDQFRSVPGGVYPVYHVLADLGEFSGQRCCCLDFARPLTVGGIALRADRRTRLMIANLAAVPQTLSLPDAMTLGGSHYRVRQLDATTRLEAMSDPEAFRATGFAPVVGSRVRLTPYSIATIDVISKG